MDAMDEDGKYRANFGYIYDQNQFSIKQFAQDGGSYPIHVISYKPNESGLYNMAGNVTEWTAERPETDWDSSFEARELFSTWFQQSTAWIGITIKADSVRRATQPLIDSIYNLPGRKLYNALTNPPGRIIMNAVSSYIDSCRAVHQDSFFKYNWKKIKSIRESTTITYADDTGTAKNKVRQKWRSYKVLVDELIKNDTQRREYAMLRAKQAESFKKYWAYDFHGDKPLAWNGSRRVWISFDSHYMLWNTIGEDMARVLAPDLLHNAIVLHKNPGGRIVKGGSWADGTAYLQCGARQVFSEDKSSARIGFRVVMVERSNPTNIK
jgi:hypothetical protein